MSKFLNGLVDNTNYRLTENGAVAHKTTKSDLLDMFAMGAAMRNRSDEDIVLMFRKAYKENPVYALKCLFYIRDIRGGQGERRFFRICIKDLAERDPEAMRRNLKNIPEFGRWDDLYELVGTPVEKDMWDFMRAQLALDVRSETPSLLAKWMKSENTSSQESRKLGKATRIAMHMNARQYRKTLSILRQRINVLERLMSAGKWDQVEFDKIPSKAGMIYRNAFARHDVERMKMAVKADVQSYEDFAKDTTKTVNAKDLYPYEIVGEAIDLTKYSNDYYWEPMKSKSAVDPTQRAIVNKYWENYLQSFDDFKFNGIAVVDTSASMLHYGAKNQPMNVAISLGMCCAEKAIGPYHGYYVSFSSRPQLVKVEGVDFVDKVKRIYETNICENTNIEGVFKLLLKTAIKNHCTQDEIPENVIIISDMQIDAGSGYRWGQSSGRQWTEDTVTTEMENIRSEWAAYGYECPRIIYWNVDNRQNTILDLSDKASFVSGMSPTIFKQITSGQTAMDLMYAVLNSDRYKVVE